MALPGWGMLLLMEFCWAEALWDCSHAGANFVETNSFRPMHFQRDEFWLAAEKKYYCFYSVVGQYPGVQVEAAAGRDLLMQIGLFPESQILLRREKTRLALVVTR
jgi:hypothetical protein